jgi:hypothetical protein
MLISKSRLVLLASALVLVAVPTYLNWGATLVVQGINLYGTVSDDPHFTDPEFNRYKNLVTDLLQGKEKSLSPLVKFKCDASRCLHQGGVMIQIVAKVGDRKFFEMASALAANDREQLEERLMTGVDVEWHTEWQEFGRRYPKTASLLPSKGTGEFKRL